MTEFYTTVLFRTYPLEFSSFKNGHKIYSISHYPSILKERNNHIFIVILLFPTVPRFLY